MDDKFLNNKTVVFIGQNFYDYHEKICFQLKEFGASVMFYENKIFREDPVLNNNDLISKIKRVINPKYKEKYKNKILRETEGKKIDVLFCIGGFSLSLELISELKKRNPKMKTVIYFWDSFAIYPYQNLISAFDNVFSFERLDCEKYNLTYLPLFYSESSKEFVNYIDRDIDVLYAGSVGIISRNRFEILGKVRALCKQMDLKELIYLLYIPPKHNLFIKVINKFRALLDNEYWSFKKDLVMYQHKYEFIYNKPLTAVELSDLSMRSKSVIDIPVKGQSGLTMRSIESLAMGCKLITTNSSIQKEFFYDEQWIMVIEEENISIDPLFLSNKPRENINISHLTLENWLTKIITS